MPDLNAVLSFRIVNDCLRCPVCKEPLIISPDGRSLLCRGPRTHCFDGASGGYVPLAPRHPGGGDAKDAVRARSGFLNHGYYEKACEALCGLVRRYVPAGGTVLDAGCGEGYYSNRVSGCGFELLGADLSKFAVDTAAKAAKAAALKSPDQRPRTVYAVASLFDLPVRDACMDAVINIFAPCAPDEFARVLKPGGILIVAGAGVSHLFGLKQLIYDDPYLNDPRRDLPKENDPFVLEDVQTVTYDTVIRGHEDIEALFSMTPYYWRTSREGRERLSDAALVNTPVSFEFHMYRKND